MRAFVFTDRALERQAGRFVWLSIDAEQEKNAAFLEKYPIEAFPTFLVLDAEREQAAFRWLGGASVAQLGTLFDDAERALRSEGAGAGATLVEADRLMGAGKNQEAAAAYREALARTPRSSPDRERVVESLLTTLSMTGADDGCLQVARDELPADASAHFAAVAGAGLGCALGLEGDAKSEGVAIFEPAVRGIVENRSVAMAVDDRSALFGMLVDASKDREDDAGAKKAAGAWLAFLDEEAARAPSPRARAVFDPHRLVAAIEAGTPERALEFLSRSEQDFPKDYNPPARLALAYREMGRYPDAIAAADRALRLAYGPRKIRIFSTRADILEKQGDKEGEIRTLEDALHYAQGLPKAQASQRTLEALQKRIAKLSGSETPSDAPAAAR